MTIRTIIKNLKRINLKTIIFNFKHFDFKTAVKLPVLIHRKTKIDTKGGIITLPDNIRHGMVRFGYGGAIFDLKDKRSLIQVKGNLIFRGSASFGNGTTISISKIGRLVVGDKFSAGSCCKLLSRKHITFESNCLLSWGVTVMDTDFHYILNDSNNVINPDSSVLICNNVWIGCNSTILKGVHISKGSIVAAGSVISKTEDKSNVIIGSNSQRVIKEGINWRA